VNTLSARIDLGLTKSDRAGNYIPSCDGFRAGAEQEIFEYYVEVPVGMRVEEIAEAAFEATNHPYPESLTGVAGALAALVEDDRLTRMRSLSVGDTVTVNFGGEGARVVVEPFGFSRI
jgi:hypothetical protein